VESLPEHLQRDAASGALGYVPFLLGTVIPDDLRTYVVDLGRISTISWRSVHERIAMGDPKWGSSLQTAICRFFAARTLKLSANFAELFKQQVVDVEALTPSSGNPPRVRIRLHFADGQALDLEGPAPQVEVAEPRAEFIRPGLSPDDQGGTDRPS
jgi:hypothetical protein